MSDSYRERIQQASNRDEACEAIVDMICGGRVATPYNMQVMYQLYAYASCNLQLKVIMQEWVVRSQPALEPFCDPLTARALDAFLEGITLHDVTEREPMGRDDIMRVTVRRIIVIRHPSVFFAGGRVYV